MGLRYQKRVNIGDGVGLNISKSSISPSYRNKYGSVGFKGFSIRTGIPGLSFRSSFGGKNGGAVMMIMLIIAGFVLVAIILYNIALFLGWVIVETYHFILRQYYAHKMKQG